MALAWQTTALSIPTAVRTVLRSKYVRSGLSRGKGGTQIEKWFLTNVSFCLWNPVQPSLLTSTDKIYHLILSLSMSSCCSNRQFYKLVCVKLFTLSLLAMYPPCWLFSRSSPQRLLWLCTSHQMLQGVSHRSPAWRAQLPLPSEVKHTFSWCPHKHFQGKCASLMSVWDLPCLCPGTFPNEDTLPPFFFNMEKCSPLYMKRIQLKQNCSVKFSIYPSKCTWSKIFPWNLVFIQDHRCRYLSTKGFTGARRGTSLQTFLVLQYQAFVSQTLRRGEMEFGSQPNSEILFSPYCSL